MIDFECCYHAELKLKERRISKTELEEVLTNPENLFLDVETGNLIAVGIRKSIKDHKLIIAYSSGEKIKLDRLRRFQPSNFRENGSALCPAKIP